MREITIKTSGLLHWNKDYSLWELEGEPMNELPEALSLVEKWNRLSGFYGKATLTITSIDTKLDPTEE